MKTLVIGGRYDGEMAITEPDDATLRATTDYGLHRIDINHMTGGFEVTLWIHESLKVEDAIQRLMRHYRPGEE